MTTLPGGVKMLEITEGPASMAMELNFGLLESLLADLQPIASAKRTKFQARLKNFHRLKLLTGASSGQGKAAKYQAGDVIVMALAVELSQLGLSPERCVRLLTDDENTFPLRMAIHMAARHVRDRPQDYAQPLRDKDDPAFMFLYFDPTVLEPLMREADDDHDSATATFFYGGMGDVRDSIGRWTAGSSAPGLLRRLALINVTALVNEIAGHFSGGWGTRFLNEVIAWTDEYLEIPSEFDQPLAPEQELELDQKTTLEASTGKNPARIPEIPSITLSWGDMARRGGIADILVAQQQFQDLTARFTKQHVQQLQDSGINVREFEEVSEVMVWLSRYLNRPVGIPDIELMIRDPEAMKAWKRREPGPEESEQSQLGGWQEWRR